MYEDVLWVINNYMNIIKPRNPEMVLKFTMKIRLAYYDAAYVATASEEDLTLVTDDKRLIKKINDNRRLSSNYYVRTWWLSPGIFL